MIRLHNAEVFKRCRASIIMPAYNAAATIAESIDSALAQTEADLELIIIDDQSRDGTLNIATSFADHDSRVRILQLPRNSGPAAARNAGLDAARGDWIALLDADDLYTPERLTCLLELARINDADIVSDNLLITTAGGDTDPYFLLPPGQVAGPQQMSTAAFVAGNNGKSRTHHESYGFMQPLVSREFLSRHGIRYDAQNRFGEDYLFYLKCLRANARWWITPEAMYNYRVSANSATAEQSSGDLRRISDIESILLADSDICADLELVAALKQHKAKIDRGYFYRAFTDAVKARQPSAAVALLLHSPQALLAIIQEIAVQLPAIMRKASAGGYGSDLSSRAPASVAI